MGGLKNLYCAFKVLFVPENAQQMFRLFWPVDGLHCTWYLWWIKTEARKQLKGLLHYVIFGDKTFVSCLTPWGHYTAGVKEKSSPWYTCDLSLHRVFLCAISIFWGSDFVASAQKNAHIFKSNAPTWMKLGVGLDHMYTNGWNFLLQLCNVLME